MITIKKYEAPNCKYCKMVDSYLRTEADFVSGENLTIEVIDIVNDLTDAERDKLPFSSVPVMEFYRNGHLMATSRGLAIPDEFRDCVQIAREAK